MGAIVSIRRVALAALVATAASTLVGCTQVQPNTGALVDQLRLMPIVEDVYGYATPGNPFEDPESSINVTLKPDADPAAVGDLVGIWRDGVDSLKGDVSLYVDVSPSAIADYATLSINTRPDRDDLVALAEDWGSWAKQAVTLDVYLDDYDPDTFASVNLDMDASQDLSALLAGLADESNDLPDNISWSISQDYPTAFTFSASDGLPDAAAMDVVAGLAAPLESGETPTRIDVSSYTIDFDSGPLTLQATVEFDTPGLSDLTDTDAAQRVQADPVWASIQTYVDRVPHDVVLTAVTFQIFSYRVGVIDTENCGYRQDNITGPLTDALWRYWLRDGGTAADGSTVGACA